MNKRLLVLLTIGLVSFGNAFAQEQEKAETPMKIEVKEKNGELELTITKEEGGYPVEQIYTGEEAKKKLAEIEGTSKDLEKQVDYEVTMEDDVMTLKVITREDGNETIEIFEGAEAEAKLKELESGEQKRASDFNLKSQKTKVLEKSVD